MLGCFALIEGEEQKRKFERLYCSYEQTMYYAAYRILKQIPAAEDAVHQAFLRLIDHLDKIDEADSCKTRGFLVVMTEHIAIDMFRKQKREQALSYEELEDSIADTTQCSDEAYALWQAVSKLPMNDATVLKLKFSHGYENAEIARILHITEDSVRQRISRAKKRLAKAFKEEG